MTADQANAVIAFFALIVAATSVLFTYRSITNQERFNALSVVPLPFIALADYENLIRVKIRNDGNGPLLVKAVHYEANGIKDEHKELVTYCPPMPSGMAWSNFSSGYVRSIRAGSELILIESYIDLDSESQIYYRDELRAILKDITVSVDYTDIYGGKFDQMSRKLDFFGRRIASSNQKGVS